MRWTDEDTSGLIVAIAITTLPLLGIVWLGDGLSKDPIGPTAYIVPSLVGCSAAILSSLIISRVADIRGRMVYHTGCAIYLSAALVVTSCLWWGEWAYGFFR